MVVINAETPVPIEIVGWRGHVPHHETITVLTEVERLLETPDRWTTGTFAKTADGKPVVAAHPKATCWCPAGAINRIAPQYGPEVWADARFCVRTAVQRVTGEQLSTMEFNDRRRTTHADVRRMLAEATAFARRRWDAYRHLLLEEATEALAG